MTTDCSTIKELTEKSQKGMIDISKLLDDEFKNSEGEVKKIIFCDRENVICLYNSKMILTMNLCMNFLIMLKKELI